MARKILEHRIICGYCKASNAFLADNGLCTVCGKFPQFRSLLPGDPICIFDNDTLVSHRPWFKVFFNPILRKIQFWSKNPYVIVSLVDDLKNPDYDINKILLGYSFQRQI